MRWQAPKVVGQFLGNKSFITILAANKPPKDDNIPVVLPSRFFARVEVFRGGIAYEPLDLIGPFTYPTRKDDHTEEENRSGKNPARLKPNLRILIRNTLGDYEKNQSAKNKSDDINEN